MIGIILRTYRKLILFINTQKKKGRYTMSKFLIATILFIIMGILVNTLLPLQFTVLLFIALPVFYFAIFEKLLNISLFREA